MNLNYSRTAVVTIRVILGLLFLVSAIGKLINSSDAQYLVELLATKFYWLIEYQTLIVTGTSVLELILSILLLWGKYLRLVLTASLIMLAGFSSVLGYFYLQGMSVENCGCFGAFGFSSGLEFTLFRNAFLILLVIVGFFLAGKNHESG